MARRKQKKSSGNRLWMIMGVMILALIGYAYWQGSFSSTAEVASSHNIVQAHSQGDSSKKNRTFVESVKEAVGLGDTATHKTALAETSTEKNVNKAAETSSQTKSEGTTTKPVAHGKARMAIVLDDFGYSLHVIGTYNAMPIPLTYAVLPFERYSTEAANSGYAAGKQIIVHLPIESVSNVTPEPITLRTSMSNEEIASRARRALQSIPHAIGMNNHQGSKGTADARLMGQVISILAQKGMFIVDSRTTAKSVIPKVASAHGVPYAVNTMFIDNSSDVSTIKEQLRQAASIALRHGSVIVIGHDRPNTAKALAAMIAPLQEEGIEFVFVSTLVQ